MLHCLNDQSASLVGLTDQRGNLVAQYSYLPYGQTRSVEYFTPPPGYTPPNTEPYDGPPASLTSSKALLAAQSNRIGHQGLRFERYDRPWEDPFEPQQDARDPDNLGAFSGLYHNRNRMYSPTLGRFTSGDPKGLGGPLPGSSAFRGRSLTLADAAPDVVGQSGDLSNIHLAYRSNPLASSDPLGLYTWDEWKEDSADGAGLAWNAYQTFTSFTDVHGLVQSIAQELVTEYSDNLSYDVDWALDWKANDGAHTRNDNKWVNLALARGAYQHFNLEYWNHFADRPEQGPVLAHSFDTGPARETAHHIGTFYAKIGASIKRELRRAGVAIHRGANIVKVLGHYGPHDERYHEWVLKNIQEINRRAKARSNEPDELNSFLERQVKRSKTVSSIPTISGNHNSVYLAALIIMGFADVSTPLGR